MNADWMEILRHSITVLFLGYIYFQFLFSLLDARLKRSYCVYAYYFHIIVCNIFYDHILDLYLHQYRWYIPLGNTFHLIYLIFSIWLSYKIFSGSFVKIQIAIMITEALSVSLCTGSVAIFRFLFKMPPYLNLFAGEGIVFPLTLLSMFAAFKFVMFFGKDYFNMYRQKEPRHKKILMFIFILQVAFGHVSYWIMRFRGPSLLLLVFSIVFVSFIVLFYDQNKSLYMQKHYLMQQQALTEAHTTALQNHIEITKVFRDDISCYIDDLQHLPDVKKASPAVQKYMEDLLDTWKNLSYTEYCSDMMINYFLHHISRSNAARHLTIQIDFQQFEIGNISSFDILGVLHHLYNYVFENRCQTSDSPQEISLQSKTDNNYFILRIIAPASLDFDKNTLNSYHAIGLIKSIIRKYRGTLEMDVQLTSFCVTAQLQHNL